MRGCVCVGVGGWGAMPPLMGCGYGCDVGGICRGEAVLVALGESPPPPPPNPQPPPPPPTNHYDGGKAAVEEAQEEEGET